MRVNASNIKTPLPLDLKSYFFLGESFVTSCQIPFSRMLPKRAHLRCVVLHMLRCAEHARVGGLPCRRSMRSSPASQSSKIPLRVGLQLVKEWFSHPGSMHIVMELWHIFSFSNFGDRSRAEQCLHQVALTFIPAFQYQSWRSQSFDLVSLFFHPLLPSNDDIGRERVLILASPL